MRLGRYWRWYAFAIRDNGLIGYLRNWRAFENLRRDVFIDLYGA